MTQAQNAHVHIDAALTRMYMYVHCTHTTNSWCTHTISHSANILIHICTHLNTHKIEVLPGTHVDKGSGAFG